MKASKLLWVIIFFVLSNYSSFGSILNDTISYEEFIQRKDFEFALQEKFEQIGWIIRFDPSPNWKISEREYVVHLIKKVDRNHIVEIYKSNHDLEKDNYERYLNRLSENIGSLDSQIQEKEKEILKIKTVNENLYSQLIILDESMSANELVESKDFNNSIKKSISLNNQKIGEFKDEIKEIMYLDNQKLKKDSILYAYIKNQSKKFEKYKSLFKLSEINDIKILPEDLELRNEIFGYDQRDVPFSERGTFIINRRYPVSVPLPSETFLFKGFKDPVERILGILNAINLNQQNFIEDYTFEDLITEIQFFLIDDPYIINYQFENFDFPNLNLGFKFIYKWYTSSLTDKNYQNIRLNFDKLDGKIPYDIFDSKGRIVSSGSFDSFNKLLDLFIYEVLSSSSGSSIGFRPYRDDKLNFNLDLFLSDLSIFKNYLQSYMDLKGFYNWAEIHAQDKTNTRQIWYSRKGVKKWIKSNPNITVDQSNLMFDLIDLQNYSDCISLIMYNRSRDVFLPNLK